MDEKQLTIGLHEATGRFGTGRGRASRVVFMDAKGAVLQNVGANHFHGPDTDVVLVKMRASAPTRKSWIVRGFKTLRSPLAPRSKLDLMVVKDPALKRAALKRAVVASKPASVSVRAPAERLAITNFKAEADRLGVPLGAAATDDEARERLGVVAADATDIFATPDLALTYLTTRPLDGRGRNGIQILREKGLPGVLASLDNKRFGSRG